MTIIYRSLIALGFNYFSFGFVFFVVVVFVLQGAERVWKGLQVPALPPRVPGAELHHVQRNLHWTCKSRFRLANLHLQPCINTYFPCWDNPEVSFTLLRDQAEMGGLEGKIWGQGNRNRRRILRVLFLFRVTRHTCNPQPQTLWGLSFFVFLQKKKCKVCLRMWCYGNLVNISGTCGYWMAKLAWTNYISLFRGKELLKTVD